MLDHSASNAAELSDDQPRLRQALLFVVGLLIAFVGQFASLMLWFHPDKASTIWIPGGIVLAFMLLRPKRDWFAFVLGIVIGGGTALMPLGRPYSFSFLGYALCCAAISVAARIVGPTLPSLFSSIVSFSKYLMVAVVALPATTGTVTAWLLNLSGLRKSFLEAWLTVTPAHAMSFLLLTPPIVVLARLQKPLLPNSWAEATLLCFGVLFFSLGLWLAVPPTPTVLPVLLFAPVPLLLIAALRFGVLGSSIGLLLVAIPAAGLGIYRNGPFATDGGQADVHMLQLWLLAVGLLIHALAIQAQQQHTMQARVQRLATGLLKGQETERSRMARELHDGINQRLALLAIKMSRLKTQVPGSAPERVDEAQRLIESVTDDVRRLSHNLHPAILDHVGLTRAMKSLVDEAAEHWDGKLTFEFSGADQHPSYDISLGLYRIAQEALANAIRHAGARRIDVRLSQELGSYKLAIEDDGRGFDMASMHRQGLGLLSMEERVALLHGQLNIRSEIGRGTQIFLQVPARV